MLLAFARPPGHAGSLAGAVQQQRELRPSDSFGMLGLLDFQTLLFQAIGSDQTGRTQKVNAGCPEKSLKFRSGIAHRLGDIQEVALFLLWAGEYGQLAGPPLAGNLNMAFFFGQQQQPLLASNFICQSQPDRQP